MGGSAGVSIAYSNECFELWLLLHFADVSDEQPIPRKDLYAMLEAMIRKCADPQFKYEHGNAVVLNYVQQYGNEAMAIQRAEALRFSKGSLLVLGATICWGLENNCTRQSETESRQQFCFKPLAGFGNRGRGDPQQDGLLRNGELQVRETVGADIAFCQAWMRLTEIFGRKVA